MDQPQLLQIQLSPQTHVASSAANMAQPQAQPNGRLFMCSALYLILCEGQTEKVLALLQRDGGGAAAPLVTVAGGSHARCDLREVTVARNTALHIAAEQGHTKLVRELVSRDSSLLSAQYAEQDTPLHCAARAGRGEAVPFIVRMAQGLPHHEISGILAIKNEAGDTALHVAARHGHGAAVEAVASASPWLSSVLNHAGASPLYLAAMSGSERAVRAIIRSVDASAAGPSSQNALHAAVFQTTGY